MAEGRTTTSQKLEKKSRNAWKKLLSLPAFLQRLRIGAKLSLGFSITILLILVVSATSIVQMRFVAGTYDRLLGGSVRLIEDALVLESRINQQIAAVTFYISAPTPYWRQAFEQVDASVREHVAAMRGLVDEQGAALLDAVAQEHEQLALVARKQMEHVDHQRREQAVLLQTDLEARAREIQRLTGELIGRQRQAVEADRGRALHRERSGELTLLAIAALALLVGALLAVGLTRHIISPLGLVTARARRIAAGDLSGDLTGDGSVLRRQDEIGVLAAAFHEMVTGLRSLVRELNATGEELAANSDELTAAAREAARSTEQIAATMDQVASRAGEQTEAVYETRRAIEELKTAIDQIAGGAQQQSRMVHETSDVIGRMMRAIQSVADGAETVARSAHRTVEVARRGGDVVAQAVRGMGDIRQTVLATADRVRELGAFSDQVVEIVQVISDIADQTNLLALNAAIEAARAGDHGKGFAVVADEVRKLAERSASSAGEIGQLVTNMKRRIDAAVAAMEEGTGQVQEGAEKARQAGEALAEILQALEETNRQVQRITEDARQMSAQVDQVSAAVDGVASVTEQSTAAAEQMAAQSEQVARAIESISAGAEETAASSQQVRASTEELNASAAQVTSAAERLAAMARRLQSLIARFAV